jgi:pimeloyl-ACP methyl ester carboxylesterase
MLEDLVTKGMLLSKLTCVGHSLGAHICGLVAALFKKTNHGIVAILVALDPAGIRYRDIKNSFENDPNRLRKGDAGYTIVIHTGSFTLGWEEPLGDADFYPNYGFLQPCCYINNIPNPLMFWSN